MNLVALIAIKLWICFLSLDFFCDTWALSLFERAHGCTCLQERIHVWVCRWIHACSSSWLQYILIIPKMSNLYTLRSSSKLIQTHRRLVWILCFQSFDSSQPQIGKWEMIVDCCQVTKGERLRNASPCDGVFREGQWKYRSLLDT